MYPTLSAVIWRHTVSLSYNEGSASGAVGCFINHSRSEWFHWGCASSSPCCGRLPACVFGDPGAPSGRWAGCLPAAGSPLGSGRWARSSRLVGEDRRWVGRKGEEEFIALALTHPLNMWQGESSRKRKSLRSAEKLFKSSPAMTPLSENIFQNSLSAKNWHARLSRQMPLEV